MITLWGRSTSSNVQKVLWLCTELDIAYEQIQIGREFGQNDEAWYRAMNPNGLVPTIRDGEVVLWESNAILRYLASRYKGGRLYPNNPAARAAVDQWLDWQLSIVNPAITPVFWGLFRTEEDKRDMKAIEAGLARLGRAWTLVETALDRHPYLAGDSLTLADIALGNAVHRWFNFALEKPDMPNLAAWYQRLQGHEGFHRHIFTPEIV